jgi:nucleotide-binding universal stress UspA family protein
MTPGPVPVNRFGDPGISRPDATTKLDASAQTHLNVVTGHDPRNLSGGLGPLAARGGPMASEQRARMPISSIPRRTSKRTRLRDMGARMQDFDPPAAVVVGIDGSKAAVRAALWAIDEAVDRDIPLRLIYAIDPRNILDRDPDSAAHRLATADSAVRYAFMAIEASCAPVKIEAEIVQEDPVTALTRASHSAALMCVGAVGLRPCHARVGSTAAALMSFAQCSLAVVREYDSVLRRTGGFIAAQLNQSPYSSALIEQAVQEARLRRAPLRALTTSQTRVGASVGDRAAGDRECVLYQVDRQLEAWIRRYPEMDISSVTLDGTIVDYLAEHAPSVELVVVGADDPGRGDEGDTPAGHRLLSDTDSSVLIVRCKSDICDDRAAVAGAPTA